MCNKQYETVIQDDGSKAYFVPGYSFGIVQFEASHRDCVFEFVWKKKKGKSNLNVVWMVDDAGVPVGFLTYWLHLDREVGDRFRFVLESIEIRESYRGRGLAKFLISKVEGFVGEEMFCTGHYILLGYRALNGFLPVADASSHNNHGVGAIEFENMSFVRDWDRMIPAKL